MVLTEDLCSKLRANDPNVTVVRTYEMEDEDFGDKKLTALLEAAKRSNHLRWLYVDFDGMAGIDGTAWTATASIANISRSLEKLWVWSLAQQTRTEDLSQFFAAMNPRAVSMQGLGVEIQEPIRPFRPLERACVENFFARNDTITIVNILCEGGKRQQQEEIHPCHAAAVAASSSSGGSSFLDCALKGLEQNVTVQHLILRHSNQDGVACRMLVRSDSIRDFFRNNQSIQTVGFLVGDSAEAAEALGSSLSVNRRWRELTLHHVASQDAAIAFFSHLASATKISSLILRGCHLSSSSSSSSHDVATRTNSGACLDAFSSGLRDCSCIKKLDMEFQDEQLSLDDLLQSLEPSLIQHPSLHFLRIAGNHDDDADHRHSFVLGEAGGSALGACLVSNQVLQDLTLEVDEITDRGAIALANKIPSMKYLQSLHLKCSVMTQESCELFADALHQNQSLVECTIFCAFVFGMVRESQRGKRVSWAEEQSQEFLLVANRRATTTPSHATS